MIMIITWSTANLLALAMNFLWFLWPVAQWIDGTGTGPVLCRMISWSSLSKDYGIVWSNRIECSITMYNFINLLVCQGYRDIHPLELGWPSLTYKLFWASHMSLSAVIFHGRPLKPRTPWTAARQGCRQLIYYPRWTRKPGYDHILKSGHEIQIV